jgi:hypothetical protein
MAIDSLQLADRFVLGLLRNTHEWVLLLAFEALGVLKNECLIFLRQPIRSDL